MGAHITRRRRTSGAISCLAALAASVLMTGPVQAAPPVNPPDPPPDRYVAMGDSFASGDGLPPYQKSPDGSTACHRSAKSYPAVLATRKLTAFDHLTSVACTGAGTGGLSVQSPDGTVQAGALDSYTETVSMTFGGYDSGYGFLIQDCLFSSDPAITASLPSRGTGCRFRDAQFAAANLRDLSDDSQGRSIVDLLIYVHSLAPRAHIYVSGYPKSFGTKRTAGNLCRVSQQPIFIGNADTNWLRNQAIAVNAVIRDAAATARKSGVGVDYVNLSKPFEGHEVCGPLDPWLNPLILTTPPELSPIDQASFHPTATGQAEIADAFAAASLHPTPGGNPRT